MIQILGTLLPDETIYSWCAFQHVAGLSVSSARSASILFGSSHAMRQHDLPATLGSFVLIEGGQTGQIENLLVNHTVGAFYWPFLQATARKEIIQAILDKGSAHWRRRLCAASRTRPFEHPLKWCVRCAIEDVQNHGRAYWHVQHQLPASYACVRHACRLQLAAGRHKTWLQVPSVKGSDNVVSPNVVRLSASLTHAITKLDLVDVSGLRDAVLLRLRDLGVILSLYRTQHERILHWFIKSEVAKWCATNDHGLQRLADGKWIPGLLWRRRASHPVLWPVLWAALEWSSNELAISAFLDAASGLVQLPGGQLHLPNFDVPEVTAAPEHVRKAFMSSSSYAEVIVKLGATRGDLVRWLERDGELRRDWRSQLRIGKQQMCEESLRNAVLNDLSTNRRMLETACGAELRWMREHAPRKLNEMLRSVSRRLDAQPTLFD